MSKEAWALIKQDNKFNVLIYRRGLTVLIVSLILSCVLGLLIFRIYVNMPERTYYATSGIAPPVELKALLTPNNSPKALLEPDPVTDDVPRVIPQ